MFSDIPMDSKDVTWMVRSLSKKMADYSDLIFRTWNIENRKSTLTFLIWKQFYPNPKSVDCGVCIYHIELCIYAHSFISRGHICMFIC